MTSSPAVLCLREQERTYGEQADLLGAGQRLLPRAAVAPAPAGGPGTTEPDGQGGDAGGLRRRICFESNPRCLCGRRSTAGDNSRDPCRRELQVFQVSVHREV